MQRSRHVAGRQQPHRPDCSTLCSWAWLAFSLSLSGVAVGLLMTRELPSLLSVECWIPRGPWLPARLSAEECCLARSRLHCHGVHKFMRQSALRRGVDEGGALGFLTGAWRGLVGALVRPLDSLLATCATLANSLRTLLMGPPAIAPRIRPPRYVPDGRPLPSYNIAEVPPAADACVAQPWKLSDGLLSWGFDCCCCHCAVRCAE